MPKALMERTPHSLVTEGVLEQEQTLSIQKPFWVMFVGNIGIATWLMGVLLAGIGLNFADAMFVLLIAGIAGSSLPAALGILGPLSRLSQMEASRFSLGRIGKRFPAFLNWISCIGWDAVVNILSASALIEMLASFGLPVSFWLALALLVVIQLVIGVYGHHLIQSTSRYSGILLGLLFVVIGVIAIHKTNFVAVADKPDSMKNVFSGLVLLAVYNVSGWTTFAADYTRYLPKQTPSRAVFFTIFLALFLSFFVLAFFGYVTAATVTEQTPQGVMQALQRLTGHFAPLVLFLVAFNSIPVNAINDNSAAYSLMSAGFKLSRPIAAIFGSVLGYIICLLASNSFTDAFENFLFLYAHWIAPWAAILLVHWFVVGKKIQTTPSGITHGCIILLVVSAASIGLFSANSLYKGLLSNFFGGIDVGPYIGFFTAGIIYYVSLRLWPAAYRVSPV